MKQPWIGVGAAVLLAAAMIAIALLGLTPRAQSAVVTRTAAVRSPRGAAARSGSKPRAVTPTTPDTFSGKPLAGKKIGVDPGHNGRAWTDPTYIDHQVWNGREYEDCNTTGTQTDGGYTEALFNWNVGRYLAADLRTEGAKVIMTRHNNRGIGPCITKRAQMFNQAHVAVGVAIHGDGGPAGGRGFAVLEPVKDGINTKVIKPSRYFDRILARTYRHQTGMPYSTYDGTDGLKPRDDLAGENLTRVPYGLIECGNMRNAEDARRMVRTSFQRRAAQAIARSITEFLTEKRK